jgi:hypothetical protein
MGAETNLAPATTLPEKQAQDTVLETETVAHGSIFGGLGDKKRHVTTAGHVFQDAQK